MEPLDYPDETVKRELEVIEFWNKNNIFEKSVASRPKGRNFVFYDGPPFATGLPHYGHLLGSTLKDVFPRYYTMKGFRVERVWGWDCHGLPIENMIEKELNIKGGKKGIEELGIDKFCSACRTAVLRLDEEWQKFIGRIGRWVDMKNSYKTMDAAYIESVWWAFKTLWEKGLVYEGRRVILYCPRCATPLSNFEIAMDNSYQDVEDDSLYVKFKVRATTEETRESIQRPTSNVQSNEYLLAWTTTPWTLPGNVALAVDRKADYARIKLIKSGDILILAKKRLEVVKDNYVILSSFKGESLLNVSYEPLYDYFTLDGKKAYYVVPADFVNLEEGSGIVHTAAIYGEEDYNLSLKLGLPMIPMLDDEGHFLAFVKKFSGKFFKEANSPIVEDLRKRNLIYLRKKIIHSYPFCYRCETPLFYNAVPAWFINIQKIKSELLKQNENINWHPSHYKHGQFKNIIKSSPDWNISRSRYWGSPLPVWVCRACKGKEIVGSFRELKEKVVDRGMIGAEFDPHRPFIDGLKLRCSCGGEMVRVLEVFDCWVESASMPFAAKHYPFENKEWFEENYPADFIGEYSGQVRAWFNLLHRVSVALFGKNCFKNVSVTGVYLGTDGKKMSKSRGNFPDPMKVANRYGVDALRFYMMGSPVMRAEDVIISEEGIREARNQLVNIFYHCFNFLRLYSPGKFDDEWPASSKSFKPQKGLRAAKRVQKVLNDWIVSRTEHLVFKVTMFMDGYDTVNACRILREYISDLSTWYLRRSREAIRNGDLVSTQVLATSLIKFAKAAAPIIPFVTENVYRDLTGKLSVHLEFWPKADSKLIDVVLEGEMEIVREIVEKGHAARKESAIKVRQPLSKIEVRSGNEELNEEFKNLILEELNVKKIIRGTAKGANDVGVKLDTKITPELKLEGDARELIRSVQDLRKKAGCSVKSKIIIYAPSWAKGFEDYVKKETLASEIRKASKLSIEVVK